MRMRLIVKRVEVSGHANEYRIEKKSKVLCKHFVNQADRGSKD